MANEGQLARLKASVAEINGCAAWNQWRQNDNWRTLIDLSGADLSDANLDGVNLNGADLSDAHLIHASLEKASLSHVNFRGADLSLARFIGADLRSAVFGRTNFCNTDLRFTDLREADLSYASLSGIFLIDAKLDKADLHGADLHDAEIEGAQFVGTRLKDANLRGAYLVNARFNDAYLSGANLHSADLNNAILTDANLIRADLGGANLRGAYLTRANLSGANLRSADLGHANLRDANLRGAHLNDAGLSECILVKTILTGADMSGATVYGISVWDIQTDGAIQKNLVISDEGQPVITVDSLEVAQFVYLLLNNERIRDVINTLTTKTVLILGRFTPERKAILDAMRDDLRKHNYVPIVFDFERPTDRNYTETVRTLAHMARFIIADLTAVRSLPQELQAVIPTLAIPVQPIMHEDDKEYAMFRDFKLYHWVLPTYIYTDEAALLQAIPQQVIAPAEAKALELQDLKA